MHPVDPQKDEGVKSRFIPSVQVVGGRYAIQHNDEIHVKIFFVKHRGILGKHFMSRTPGPALLGRSLKLPVGRSPTVTSRVSARQPREDVEIRDHPDLLAKMLFGVIPMISQK